MAVLTRPAPRAKSLPVSLCTKRVFFLCTTRRRISTERKCSLDSLDYHTHILITLIFRHVYRRHFFFSPLDMFAPSTWAQLEICVSSLSLSLIQFKSPVWFELLVLMLKHCFNCVLTLHLYHQQSLRGRRKHNHWGRQSLVKWHQKVRVLFLDRKHCAPHTTTKRGQTINLCRRQHQQQHQHQVCSA